jgi:hypothetical protein
VTLAFASGAVYSASAQPDSVLATMTVG